ncbi:solute carrier family 22 member 4-like isoform X1 [Haliotis cracherodii]|uniref:solute carrier family 22 member 4-like isoform X1 n=1 Tax=Haliotis cracherodii TaxID=6455 RepID=UPI0039E9F1B5
MEDGSAQALEVIISHSDQFGFFQKRTFIATSFLQAITISVLVYTCVATPEPSTDDPCTVASTNGAEPLNETFTSFNQTVSVASTNIAHTSKACSSTDTGSFIFILTLHVPKWLRPLDGLTLSEYTVFGQVSGVILGSLIGAFFGDVYGRRKPMFVYFILMLVFHILTGVAVSWPVFVVFRIIVGLAAGAFLVVSVVMPMECIGQDWRDVCICSGMWTMGVVFLSLETLITENWRYLAFLSGAIGTPFIGTYYLVPESARWLLCQQRFKSSESGIREMISCNEHAVPGVTSLLDKARASVVGHMHHKKYTYLDLCHSVDRIKWTIALVYVCLVASTVYFCLAEKTRRITENAYVDRFLPYIVDLPLTWSAVVVNKCLGRRWCLFLYAVASGFASLSIIVLDMTGNLQSMPNMMKGLAIFGKLGVTATLSIITISAVEMFPTVIRCMGTATALLSAAAGAIMSKQFKFLRVFQEVQDENHYTVPFLVYGGMMVTVGFAALFLPETLGRPLPNILPCRHRKIPLQEGTRLVNTWDNL